MSSTFTPSDAISASKEKDWPSSLGMLDWDSTAIVFTKRSLIEFLKYTGTTVDTNFTNIAKLPKYAKFGQLSDAGEDAALTASSKPNHRRPAPGGSHADIFGHEVNDDELSTAPPKVGGAQSNESPSAPAEGSTQAGEESGINFASNVKPSRRVRAAPGGASSMSNLWDDDAPQEEFKPTRRVRQGPGGADHISGLF